MPDGKLKLGDFNQGFFQRWNTARNIPCPMQSRRDSNRRGFLMRKSLEDHLSSMPKSEKIDIWGIGTMFYYLLTVCMPYACEPAHVVGPVGTITNEKIRELKHADIPPTLPIDISNSTIPEIASIRLAMNLAFWRDPEKRPSAQSIVNLLKEN
eukprot:scaffold363691_cov55-Attheya_sp.AAC.1